MRITVAMANRLIGELAYQLNAGSLVILDGARPSKPDASLAFQPVLVSIPFQTPAFADPVDGAAVAHDLPPQAIAVSGDAGFAQLHTATGQVVADLTVRAVDAQDADQADLLLERTDFQRGGLCTISRLTLRLPRVS